MARSCTRGANVVATFGRPLGSITEVAKRLMDNILGIVDICNSLNHVHEIGGIWKMLHRIIHGPSQLIANEVEYTKSFFIRCHPIEKIWSIVSQSCSISYLGINSGMKELIEIVIVRIELVRLALNSQISATKHEGELFGLVLVLIVHGRAPLILRAKSQEPRESHLINGALVPLSCPSDGVVMRIVVVGAMELSKNFFVPIVPKTHDIIESNFLALVNDGVEHGVV
jgi:hypothetical protein